MACEAYCGDDTGNDGLCHVIIFAVIVPRDGDSAHVRGCGIVTVSSSDQQIPIGVLEYERAHDDGG